MQFRKSTPQLQLCIVPCCQKVESFSTCSYFVFINLLIYLNFGGVYFVFSWGFKIFFYIFVWLAFFKQPTIQKLQTLHSNFHVCSCFELLSSDLCVQFSLKQYFGLISSTLIYSSSFYDFVELETCVLVIAFKMLNKYCQLFSFEQNHTILLLQCS